MHLVFLNQYYPPDVAPTGVMLEGVVQRLVKDGHEVTVLCASGGYGEKSAAKPTDGCQGKDSGAPPLADGVGAVVLRIGATKFGRGTVLGKLLDYASFYLGVGWKLLVLKPRPTRIVALTTPPYLSVLARVGSWLRGADHAHWVMDLYPDVMAAHGMMREDTLPWRVLAGMARWGFGGSRCAAVLTLGPDMAERVGRYLTKNAPLKASWVPLWGGEAGRTQAASGEASADSGLPASDDGLALRQARGWGRDETVVMYSGNMGLGHRFGEILTAALALKDEPIRWVFYGAGRRRVEIENFRSVHPECRIELHGYAPAEQLAAHLQSADVHLASLDSAWTGTMVPSKLQGIFAVGRPVIFIGSEQSSIGQWVMASGAGWVVAAGDGAGMLAALAAARDPAERVVRGRAAGRFAAEHFDEATNTGRVAAILSGSGPAPGR